MRRPPGPGRFRAVLLVAGLLAALVGTGCRSEPAPAAASNRAIGPRTASGVGLPGEDDRWASATLDHRRRDEVRRALRSAVTGRTLPLEPARYGIRFEDVPRAVFTAAPVVEMAITSERRVPAFASVRFTDGNGRTGTAEAELRRTGVIVSVEFIDGVDAEAARIRQSIERSLRSDASGVGGSNAGDRDSTVAANDGAGLLTVLVDGVRKSGATVDAREWHPERYEIDLLMLDNEPARLVVRREPDPVVLSWEAWAGTFPNGPAAEGLGRAFMAALRGWGAVSEPTQAGPVDSD